LTGHAGLRTEANEPDDALIVHDRVVAVALIVLKRVVAGVVIASAVVEVEWRVAQALLGLLPPVGRTEFATWSSIERTPDTCAGDSRDMAELFMLLGFAAAVLLAVTRWLEDR